MDEFTLISALLAPLAAEGKGALGLTDDAAVLNIPAGSDLVVTKDAMVQGVHFIGDESPDLIARKLLRVNLSDLAAMGAKPYGYFLALMLPRATNEVWLRMFTEGLKPDQETFGFTLLGGDTVSTPGTLSLSATVLGLVPTGQALKRSGAHVGDDIYVSGSIGDGALGLRAAQGRLPVGVSEDDNGFLLNRYRLPNPRVALGEALLFLATSCIDISDGFVQDLEHICALSQVGAEIDYAALPLSDAASAILAYVKDPEQIILSGGDDYELLFTAAPETAKKLSLIAAETGIAITRVGRVVEGHSVRVQDGQGKQMALASKGYRHF